MQSREMAACNVDSRLFIGAVSRVICEPRVVRAGKVRTHQADRAGAGWRTGRWSDMRNCRGCRGMVAYRVLQQGRAPNSAIPYLAVNVAAMAMVEFGSLVELEEATAQVHGTAAHFVVEEHVLAPTSP